MQENKYILDKALLKLQALQLQAEQVRRVAVTSRGSLQIEVAEGDNHRFFVYQGNDLTELQVENESKIPLAAKLSRADFTNDHVIISYRPGRRIVLGPVRDQQAVLLKGYKKHKAAQAAKNYAVALSACEQGGFDIPELLRYEAQDDYLVMARHKGQPPVIAMDTVGTWKDIGAGLRCFQQANVTDMLSAFSPHDELMVLDERARRFLMCIPSLPEGWLAAREQLQKMASGLPPAQTGLTHRDLHDRQFLVVGKTISLLDFDLVCVADVALDPANLLAHMQLRVLQGQDESGHLALTACRDALLSGLGRQEEPGFEKRLWFYQATTFYRLALLYALRPRWSHLSASLIAGGNRCIDAFHESRDRS